MQKLALIGGGGHAKVILDLIAAINAQRLTFEVIGIYDDAQHSMILGLPKRGDIAALQNHTDETIQVFTALGNNHLREQIVNRYPHLQFATLIHPSAIVGSEVTIGSGSVVMAGCLIQAAAEIGQQCIINTGAVVDHDVRVGDYTHIAQRVTLTGGVQVGNRCVLNAGTVVAPWKIIADETSLPIGSHIG